MAVSDDRTTITIKKTTKEHLDRLVQSGEFGDRDATIDAAIIELDAVRARRARYDALIHEGLDDVAAGRVMEATPAFYRDVIDEVDADTAAGRPARFDEAVVGSLDADCIHPSGTKRSGPCVSLVSGARRSGPGN